MFDILLSAICMVIGYLLGSIPTGYLIAKSRGIDIQKMGSGNIGATNVLRSMGVFPAIVVGVMDPLKGILATMIPLLIGVGAWGVALTGLATVLGNNFNIFLGLRGGKGIATSLGVFLVINPWVTLLATALGIFTIALGRYVSLGSLVGLAATPLLMMASLVYPLPYLYLSVALAMLAIYRHRANIAKLAAGTERRLGERADPQPAQRRTDAASRPEPPPEPQVGTATPPERPRRPNLGPNTKATTKPVTTRDEEPDTTPDTQPDTQPDKEEA